MKLALTMRRITGAGEVLLLSYLLIVVGVAVARALTGWPSVGSLASSPVLLWHGQWWRLVTSALVVQGPPVPQILAIAALGTVSIYFGGSWLFWRTAVTGHIFGTLASYVWFAGLWLVDRAAVARLLVNPDYGVSLVWCAGLGVFAGWAWMGARANWRRPVRPLLAVAAVAVLLVVVAYSDPMAAVQHAVAFGVGAIIIATADRSRALHKARRPLVRVAA